MSYFDESHTDLDPNSRCRLLKLLRLSSNVTAAITTPPFFRRLAESLDKSGKAVTKLNLLRITRVVCEHHPDRQTLVERFGLANAVERLAKQGEAVLVRELAKEVIPILLFGNVNASHSDRSLVQEVASNKAGKPTIGLGMPRVEVHAGNARAASMKRTASEGMVEIAGGRVDKAMEMAHVEPSRSGRAEVGTQGTSASAEERPRAQHISIAPPALSSSATSAMKRSSTTMDTRADPRAGRIGISGSTQYVRPKTPSTSASAGHGRRPSVIDLRESAQAAQAQGPSSPRQRTRAGPPVAGDTARSGSSTSSSSSHARKHSYAALSAGVPVSAPTRLRGMPTSASSADLAGTAASVRPVRAEENEGSASGQSRPTHKRMISRSQLRSVGEHIRKQ